MEDIETIIYLTPTPPRRNALTHIWDEAESATLCAARIKVHSVWTKIDPRDNAEWGLTEARGTLPICKVCRNRHEKRRLQQKIPKATQNPLAGVWSKYRPPGDYCRWACTEHHR